MCTQSRIGSLSSLRLDRFKQVVRICLRQNNIQRLEGLEGIAETLEDLDLYDNLISHMRNLEGLPNLKSLDLSFNKIKHIKNISHMKGLKDIYLVANKISKIEGIEGLDQLVQLELGSNRIREIRNLDTLVNLEELWLAKNKITELAGLAGLPKLRLLSIQSNRISDLSPLKDAPQLEELYISHNLLTTLTGLEANKALKVIDISNNKITDLAGLEGLSDLEEFWASYNLIADFNDVEKVLRNKEHLTTVYFEGNPLQLRAPALYRNKVKLALPQVRQIDASECYRLFVCARSSMANLEYSLREDLIRRGEIKEKKTRGDAPFYTTEQSDQDETFFLGNLWRLWDISRGLHIYFCFNLLYSCSTRADSPSSPMIWIGSQFVDLELSNMIDLRVCA